MTKKDAKRKTFTKHPAFPRIPPSPKSLNEKPTQHIGTNKKWGTKHSLLEGVTLDQSEAL